jgi:hypothetical protein
MTDLTDFEDQHYTVTRSVSLENIKSKAEWVLADAVDLKHYCNMIVTLPEYETEAEWAVAAAYSSLETALFEVRRAHEKVRAKRAIADANKQEQTCRA